MPRRCTPSSGSASTSTAQRGAVSRAIVAAAARAGTRRGADDDATASWAKAEWVEAMARYGVTTRSTHAQLSALGRSLEGVLGRRRARAGGAAVFLWVPERNAYYTLGSLAAAASAANAAREGGAPVAVEAAIRAVVGVAKSTPAPPGLKAALTRDCDFLTLLGRKPKEANAPVSAGTTGGADAARAADARFLEERFPNVDASISSPATKDEMDASDQRLLWKRPPRTARSEANEDAFETKDEIGKRESGRRASRRRLFERDASSKIDLDDAEMTSDEMTSSSIPAPRPSWTTSSGQGLRDGLRRRPSREDDGEFA